MNLRLFHKIGEGGEDSAAVRQFIVDNGLKDAIEFSNVTYDESQQDLVKYAGPDAPAPVLLVDGRPILGRIAILDWMKTNLLCLRD